MTRRKDIDGLRAIAILSVVFFHAWPGRFPGGFVGVDIFFVISGFLITNKIHSDLLKDKFGFKHFYVNRIKRLYPPMLITLVFVLIAGVFLLFDTEFKALVEQSIAGLFYVANIYFNSVSGYFDSAPLSKPLLHFWSLSVEEQYYIFWPLILFLFHRFNLNKLVYSIILFIISFIACLYYTHTDPN